MIVTKLALANIARASLQPPMMHLAKTSAKRHHLVAYEDVQRLVGIFWRALVSLQLQ